MMAGHEKRPVAAPRQSEAAPPLDRMRADLRAFWTRVRMASECRMSLRTFAPRFADATGMSVGERPTSECVEEAKGLLVRRDDGIGAIATAVGMGSADMLGHPFHRHTGVILTRHRNQFRAPGLAEPSSRRPSGHRPADR